MHLHTKVLLAAGLAVAAGASPAHAATGVVHIVGANAGYSTELWYRQDGSGWRMRQTGFAGTTSWVANRKGITITIAKGSLGGPAGTDFLSREQLTDTPRKDDFPDTPSVADYLTRPWADLVVEPMEKVEDGEMRITGETIVKGEPAYDLIYSDGRLGHYFAAKDDGALLATRGLAGGYDVQTYELIAAKSAERR
jgi:hypothetical protein